MAGSPVILSQVPLFIQRPPSPRGPGQRFVFVPHSPAATAAPPPRGRSPSPALRAGQRLRSPSPVRAQSPPASPRVVPNLEPLDLPGRRTPSHGTPAGRSRSPNSRGPPTPSDARASRPPFSPMTPLKLSGPLEKAVRWDYDFLRNKWTSSPMVVRLDKQPFQKGSLRYAFHMVDDRNERFVAKSRIVAPASNKEYFEGVAMQAACQYCAQAYNRRGPPKPVSFIDSFVLQLTEREGRHFMACEEYLPGVYAKYNNNGGWTADDERNTPQAFSHFTYFYSQGKFIIVDIQGVGDRYTDPQLHSQRQRYGPGDLGMVGMQLFFNTHLCNSICRGLGLTDHVAVLAGTQMP
eukprot:EG_transcript_6123